MSAERSYYHEFGWAYDLLQREPVGPRMDFVQGILSKQGIGPNSAILDAGCGTGRYTIDLATRGYQVFGVDRSPELIAVAQGRAACAAVPPKFMIADLLVATFTPQFEPKFCRGVLTTPLEKPDRSALFANHRSRFRTG